MTCIINILDFSIIKVPPVSTFISRCFFNLFGSQSLSFSRLAISLYHRWCQVQEGCRKKDSILGQWLFLCRDQSGVHELSPWVGASVARQTRPLTGTEGATSSQCDSWWCPASAPPLVPRGAPASDAPVYPPHVISAHTHTDRGQWGLV